LEQLSRFSNHSFLDGSLIKELRRWSCPLATAEIGTALATV